MGNFKEKLKEVKREIRDSERQEREEFKKFEQNDDVVYVTGLKTSDRLLLIGGGTVFPGLKKSAGSLTSAPKTRELDSLLSQEKEFERVFFVRQMVLAEATIQKAVSLLAPGGVLCFFSDNEELRMCFVEAVSGMWPSADVWICESNIGPVVMTDASGHTSFQN